MSGSRSAAMGDGDYRAGKSIKGRHGLVIFAADRLGFTSSPRVATRDAPRIIAPVGGCARLCQLVARFSLCRHAPTPANCIISVAPVATAAPRLFCTSRIVERVRFRPEEGAGPYKRLNKQ